MRRSGIAKHAVFLVLFLGLSSSYAVEKPSVEPLCFIALAVSGEATVMTITPNVPDPTFLNKVDARLRFGSFNNTEIMYLIAIINRTFPQKGIVVPWKAKKAIEIADKLFRSIKLEFGEVEFLMTEVRELMPYSGSIERNQVADRMEHQALQNASFDVDFVTAVLQKLMTTQNTELTIKERKWLFLVVDGIVTYKVNTLPAPLSSQEFTRWRGIQDNVEKNVPIDAATAREIVANGIEFLSVNGKPEEFPARVESLTSAQKQDYRFR